MLRRTIGIVSDFIVPQPDHAPALQFQEGRPSVVISRGFDVLAAIEFDSHLCLAAGDIDDVRADDELPGETGPVA